MLDPKYASRAGEKLAFALKHFDINVSDLICADLGCSTGGFTSCLLQNQAAKVYAVDTGYGVLDYKLRLDPRIVVMERTNALHVILPQPVDFVSIDVGWTPQHLILPHALSLLAPGGRIVSLLKPHYENKKAHLAESESAEVADALVIRLRDLGIQVVDMVKSPILGKKAANSEYLFYIKT